MKRIILVAALLAPVGALAQSQFHVPDNWRPGPSGNGTPRHHNDLPVPRPGPLQVHYDLLCTLDPRAAPVVGGHWWHVRNVGSNTAPSGLHIYTQSGGFIHADFRLGHSMRPGDGDDFVSAATRFDHATTDRDDCIVSYDR